MLTISPLKLQNAAQIDNAGEQELTEVLSSTPTLKRKAASSEQRKKTNVIYFFIACFVTVRMHF